MGFKLMTSMIPVQHSYCLWWCGGLVVSVLDFCFGGRWFEPSLCRRVVSFDKKLYSTLSD